MADNRDQGWGRVMLASSGVTLEGHGTDSYGPDSAMVEATSSSLPIPRMKELASNGRIDVREAIAMRPDCTSGILASLAFDPKADVRVAVAGNERTQKVVLEHLAKDRDGNVAAAVARNARTHEGLLGLLTRHRKPDVRRIAVKRLARMEA